MLASDIIEIIERRHARLREKCHSTSGANLSEADRADLRIAEEYDSLIAEIEELRTTKLNQHASIPVIEEYPEDRSEEWILGDQGQPGE